MSKELEFSKDLRLPTDAITQKIACLGKTGSGKTHASQKLAEEMLALGAQIVVLDPIGNWYSLRLGADGKSKGYDILVLGGFHGDIALEKDMAKPIADLIVEKEYSVVLDVSLMRKGQRKEFATLFAEELFHKQKTVRRPIHLFLEEAQTFIPQRVEHGEARMLGAFEDLVKIGRNIGFGATMITQRPQAVNKDVLNQAEMLAVFQLVGPQERKAVEGWVREKGASDKLLDDLAELSVGEAIVWSPSWLRILKRVKVAKKRTFDASATPKFGQTERQPKTLSPVNIEALKKDLASFIQRSEENDPEKLKRRIRELENTPKLVSSKVDAGAIQELKARLRRAETERDTLSADRNRLFRYAEKVDSNLHMALASLETLKTEIRKVVDTAVPPIALTKEVKKNIETELSEKRPTKIRSEIGERTLGKGPRRMLQVLATWHPSSRSKAQLATLSGMSQSGTFRNYLSELRTQGLIHEGPHGVSISPTGIDFLAGDHPGRPASVEDLLQLWRPKLGGTVAKMLDILVEAYPNDLSREELAERTGIVISGTFRNYLSELRTNGLIQENGNSIAASPTLFLEVPPGIRKAVK